MDCVDARVMLLFRRPGGPGELAPDDADALARHLAGCPACAAAGRRQDGFDRSMSSAMKSVPVPTGLRDQLLADSFARAGAALRRKVYTWGGVAAGLLLTFALGTGVLWLVRPALDTAALADAHAASVEAPEATVRDWLKAEGLPPGLPFDFDYRNLVAHGKAPLQGKDVPFVQFGIQLNGARPDMARVYIVRDGQFNLKDVKAAQNSYASVIVDRGDGVAYIVLFTSPSLDVFLKPNNRIVN